MASTANPIAALLNLTPERQDVRIDGRLYEYHAPSRAFSEALYRKDAGHGVGNPAFSLALVPASHHSMVLGQYLAGREGVKRAEAEAIVAAARIERAAR